MSWWRGHAGVRARSTAAAAVVVAAALSAGLFAGYWLLKRALTTAAVAAVTGRGEEISALVAQGGHDVLGVQRQPVVGEVIQVVDLQGRLLSAAPPTAASAHLAFAVPVSARATTSSVPALPQSGADEPYIVWARRVPDGPGGAPVVVAVARSVAGLSETVGAVGQLTLVGLPLLVLVAAGATYVFTARALRPVEQMRQRVQDISASRLDERVPVPVVRDEIGRLAETMNLMLDRLEASQHTQRRFIADAGHELRSPLTTLAVALEVASSAPPAEPARDGQAVVEHRGRPAASSDSVARDAAVAVPQSLLEDARGEVSRMGRLVDGLLLLARSDERGLPVRHDDVDLDDLVHAEVARLRTIVAAGVKVTARYGAVRVSGDRDRLVQVLRNLTDNAKRHARSRIHLELTAREHGTAGQAVLTVADDGPGIPAHERERVFERFVRLDAARDRGSGGSGLGLAIVREIVRAHGGTVSVATAETGGAVFTVELPLGAANLLTSPHPPSGSSR